MDRLNEMEDALYRFFTARVGLRFLTEHYVLSSNRESAKTLRNVTSLFPVSEDSVRGCIQASCNVAHEVRRVADLVIQQTKAHYQMAPVIEIVDCTNQNEAAQNFTYVPHHLHYMVAELLKNSCRATIRKYQEMKSRGDPNTTTLSKIRVIIVKGEEDVTIKVADKGGGIPRSLMNKIWKFAHSTASEDELRTDFGTDISGARIRGFGLPLARIYARYFGGELTLKSTEGFGLDAYLHLPRLGTNCCENLPLRVRDSPGERDSTPSDVITPTMTSNIKNDSSHTRRNHESAAVSAASLPLQNRTYSTRISPTTTVPPTSLQHRHPASTIPTTDRNTQMLHHVAANNEYCHNLAM
jgi:pyruvate dehydrogenase kinase 2/3/4